MLELRPTCENCNKPLPPNSGDALICSFECTFCRDCVDKVLHNVCPNCGGGFAPRPVRPANNWNDENFLGKYPAANKVIHRLVDRTRHAAFSARIRGIAPDRR